MIYEGDYKVNRDIEDCHSRDYMRKSCWDDIKTRETCFKYWKKSKLDKLIVKYRLLF